MTEGEKWKRLEAMLRHWGEVLAFRSAGGVGYPSGQAAHGSGTLGLSKVAMDFISIEEALTEVASRSDEKAMRARLADEYQAKAEERPWSVAGWVRKTGRGTDWEERLAVRRRCGTVDSMVRVWKEKLVREWF